MQDVDDDAVVGWAKPATPVEKAFGNFQSVVTRLGNVATGKVGPTAGSEMLKRIKDTRAALDAMEVIAIAAIAEGRTVERAAKAERAKADRAMVRHLVKNPGEIARAQKLGLTDVAHQALAILGQPAEVAPVAVPVATPIPQKRGLLQLITGGKKAA